MTTEHSPVTIELSDQQTARLDAIKQENAAERRFKIAGSVMLALGATATIASIALAESSSSDHHPEVGYNVSYISEAQHAIEAVDNVLGDVGSVVVPGSLLLVGGAMIRGGSRNRWASNNLDGAGDSQSFTRKALQTVSSGSVPVLASFGAGLATFSTAIGGAITNGPSEPIESISSFAPGESWVVQYDDAKPMVESSISPALKQAIMKQAAERQIQATAFSLHLGDVTYKNQDYSNLSVGVDTVKGMPLYVDKVNCNDVPIAIDKDANIPVGATVKLDGVTAHVAEIQTGTSAINRIGVTLDSKVLAECLDKGPNNAHAVVLDTDPQTAADILQAANTNNETATVITKERYIANSEDFWRANVKPITNVLSFVSLAFAGVAMAGAAGSRLYRSRRQWAQKMADGVPATAIRGTEFIRSVKEGVFASAIGVSGAAAATPLVGVFESGLHVTTGPQEWLVGGAVGILGPVIGTMSKVLRVNKTIDKSRDTRGL